ncbi:hypothetical protein Tco_0831865 [Tanacetum coccineum]
MGNFDGNILKAYSLWETLEAYRKRDEEKLHTTKANDSQTLPEVILMQDVTVETARKYGNQLRSIIGGKISESHRLQTLRSGIGDFENERNENRQRLCGGSIRAKFKS